MELSKKQMENYEFFEKHLQEYLQNPLYENKIGVFYDCELKGIYDTAGLAFREAKSKYPDGDFIIQEIMDPNMRTSFIAWGGV